MRCKPGDLALITATIDAGKMVTCIRLEDPSVKFPDHVRGRIWLIDREMEWVSNRGRSCQIPYCPDDFLMPIRPPDQNDDTTVPQAKEVCDVSSH